MVLRQLTLFSILVLALGLAACGGNSKAQAPTAPPDSSERASFVPPTLPPEEPTLLTPTPGAVVTDSAPTAALTAAPTTAAATAVATAAVAATSTITPTPTTPPALPLRDDMPAMELQDFPRPPDDNGLGIHFLATGYYSPEDLDKQIARMKELGLKWATVVYTDENHLETAAQKFSEAGIYVVWRKALRPYQRYSSWQRDIDIIKKYNLPPYMQLYNEPELEAEWDEEPINYDLYWANLLAAAKDVYNAGGYPGIQFLDEDNLRRFIDEIYARKGEALFHRMFFIPHAYGLNHPPDYQEDANAVLGFRTFATIFFKRLGFVPPFIVGEGGWKIQSQEDNRFPSVDEKLHRDYTLAVYDWFRTGNLSNGAKLPDYLFAFDMWMLSGADEAGAWYDSSFGNRTLTIDAVTQLPRFVRKFSWDQ